MEKEELEEGSSNQQTEVSKEAGKQMREESLSQSLALPSGIETYNNLTRIEKDTVKSLIVQKGILTLVEKGTLIDKISKKLNIDLPTAKKIYRDAEKEYYLNTSKLPPEAIKEKINDESEYLKEKIISESNLDIVKQADIINKINLTVAKVNKLDAVAPLVQLNFIQDIDETTLINNGPRVVEQVNVAPVENAAEETKEDDSLKETS